MERTFSPMIRQFSAIDGLQKAYTLVYSMDADDESGCRLTLCRTGSRQCMESRYIAAAPEFGYRILRYLCENGVQPEIWQDVVEELADTEQLRQKGGALCGEREHRQNAADRPWKLRPQGTAGTKELHTGAMRRVRVHLLSERQPPAGAAAAGPEIRRSDPLQPAGRYERAGTSDGAPHHGSKAPGIDDR